MSTSETELSGVTVVVTRPAHQAAALCHSIEAFGGTTLRLPVIEIRPSVDADRVKAQLNHLDSFQLAIFISANAVFSAMEILKNEHYRWPADLAIAAVGQATAKAISENGLMVSLVSPEPYNSEALLGLTELQTLYGKRVIIFRGNGGRELLGDTLSARGAEVEYAECYQRVIPETDMSALFQLWDKGCLPLIVVTSNEALTNLQELVGPTHQQSLLASPLIVVSQRAADLAEEQGFTQKAIVAKSASNDALLSVIKRWKKDER